jgi:methionyl-tRNA formyltransferase
VTSSPKRRLAFMGTPDFARVALQALHAAGHEIVCVYSQPPRPAGRGHRVVPSPVHALADTLGIPVRTPKSLKSAEEQAAFRALNLDVAVVAAYGLILPQGVLDAPRFGCLNIHASLLPRWRGAAPIHRAILAGDAMTGITIMQMDAGLDTGAMLLSEAVPIDPLTTTPQLHDRLAVLGGDLIVSALAQMADGTLSATPQPQDGVTYAAKLTKDEARINWADPADAILRQYRALMPWPGTVFQVGGDQIKMLAAEAAPSPVIGSGPPGTLLDDTGLVACGTGAIRLLTLQRPNKGPLPADVTLRALGLKAGDLLS